MIVLDCSAAIEIAKDSDRGRALQKLLVVEEEIIAPSLFTVEVANTAWKHVHAGVLGPAQAKLLMEDALSLPDRFFPLDDLLSEAFAESIALGHSTYGMAYLVLARRHAATLFTCDKKLQECCVKRDVNCVVEVGL